jgi:glycosyltransferase involved in cell wall biosynthesis
MNLMFLDSIATDVYGGLEHWIGMVAAGLVGRGHRVVVVGRRGSEYLRRSALVSKEVIVEPLGISGDFNPVTILALKRLLMKYEIDAVVCNFNKDVRLGGLAARWLGDVRVIWRLGNNMTRDNAVHRFLTPHLLDGAITPSHELKRQIMQPGYLRDDMINVIHTGIPPARNWQPGLKAYEALREKYRLPDDATVAVTSGRFVDVKGHRYLVTAAKSIVEQHPDVHFLWLGDGPLEQELRTQINETGLRDRFLFAGLLDDFELELAGADLMLHPATVEPFGIVLLEGMRAGLPIVASRVGGIPEVVADGQTGLLVPPGDSGALETAALQLLDNRKQLASFGKAGIARWESEFDYGRMLSRVEEYISSLIGNTSGAMC